MEEEGKHAYNYLTLQSYRKMRMRTMLMLHQLIYDADKLVMDLLYVN